MWHIAKKEYTEEWYNYYRSLTLQNPSYKSTAAICGFTNCAVVPHPSYKEKMSKYLYQWFEGDTPEPECEVCIMLAFSELEDS